MIPKSLEYLAARELEALTAENARLHLIEAGARDSEELVKVLTTENASLKARVEELEDALHQTSAELHDTRASVAFQCEILEEAGLKTEQSALAWLQENFVPRTEVEAMQREWQPIETAPWDGTTIDTYTDWAPLRETDVHWDEEHKRWVRWEFDGVSQVWSECFPTHWMPLPYPPASKES